MQGLPNPFPVIVCSKMGRYTLRSNRSRMDEILKSFFTHGNHHCVWLCVGNIHIEKEVDELERRVNQLEIQGE